ncbi:MAG: response regulator [Gammaproteobacteria bacterium]
MNSLFVHIVDDDLAVQDSLSILLTTSGYKTASYRSGQEFIDRYKACDYDCLLLDINMPGMSGLELQQELNKRHIDIPTIFITAHGNINDAVLAMKNGAVDFIEKPFRGEELLTRLQSILLSCDEDHTVRSITNNFQTLFNGLTGREQEIFQELVKGQSSKEIGRTLDISFRTVEVHRARIMEKTQVKNLAELVRKAIHANLA